MKLKRLFVVAVSVLMLASVFNRAEYRPNTVQTTQIYKLFFPNVHYTPLKRGAANAYQKCEDNVALGVSWHYNWGASSLCKDSEFVPMIWGAQYIESLVQDSGWILGFNEPERADQANMTPQEGAIGWRRIEERFPNIKLVSPATMSGLANTDWLDEWYNAYISTYGAPPRISAIAYHWYGWDYDDAIVQLQRYKSLATEWGVDEIWLTEFAFLQMPDSESCWGHNLDDEIADAKRFLTRLEQDPMIARWSWYAPRIDTGGPYSFQPPQCNAPLLDLSTGTPTRWKEIVYPGGPWTK